MEYTQRAQGNLSFLYGLEKSPQEIIAFLKEDATIRTFSQVLQQLYPHPDLERRLIGQMACLTGDNPASLTKKIRNWLQDKNAPQTRQQLYQIAFCLGFSEPQANTLLGMCADTGIHYRNPNELVLAFGLRTERTYQDTMALVDTIQKKYPPLPDKKVESCYTNVIFDAFAEVYTEDGLYAFFESHSPHLGTLHYTAYCKYKEMLDQLKDPSSTLAEIGESYEEEHYSLEDVMTEYLQLHVPSDKKTSGYDLLQKVIKKYWPNSKTVANMYHQKEDVTRKALLLLYVVTQEMDNIHQEDDWDFLEDDEDDDVRLEERIYRMNLLLTQYGMNRLDPCNPFDYVVLYAMKVTEDGDMRGRMSDVFAHLFS